MPKHPILRLWCAAAMACSFLFAANAAQAATATLDAIKERGVLRCGVSQGVIGFSAPDAQGNWVGFDVDFCKALAAEIFDDPNKVKYFPLSGAERLISLQSGDIDVLSRTTTWLLTRDAGTGINFTAITYHDGQGFLVRKSLGVKSGKELNQASICVTAGSSGELNLGDFARENKIKLEVISFTTIDEAISAYKSGRCDSYSTDASGLNAARIKLDDPDNHVVLPDLISREPLGPWVRGGDDQWFDIVRWSVFGLVNAEALGVNQANVDEMAKSDDPNIKRLLGNEGQLGEKLGLDRTWIRRMVKHVGNYGDIYDRNFGPKARVVIDRGANRVWKDGGLMYAPPIR